MPTAADLTVKINADTSGAEGGIKRVDSAIKGLGGGIGKALSVGAAVGVGAVVGGIGAVGVGMGLAATSAIGFEKNMANVNSILKLSDQGISSLSNQVLTLAQNPGITDSPAQLAAGLYDVASAGFTGSDGLKILESAAIGASAGVSTTSVATDALTSVLGAYGLGADAAKGVTDEMFQTVNDGKISFEQLATNMGNVLPVAASLGVGFDQVGAGFALMTQQGIPAAQAETQMASLMKSALNPTDALTAAVQAHGYASAESLIQTEGLSGYLDVLTDASGGSKEALFAMLGTQEGMNAALALGGDNLDEYNKLLDNQKHASDGAGAAQEALNKQMESASFKIAKAKQSLQILATTMGGILTPIIGKAADALTGLLTNSIMPFVNGSLLPGIAKFGKMFSGQFDFYKKMGKSDISAAFSALGIVLENITGLNLDTWFKRMGDAMQRPINAARKMFDALGSRNWNKLIEGIGDAISSLPKLVGDALKGISTGFKPLDKLLQNTGKLFTDFGRLIQEVFQGDFQGALAVGERMLGHFGDQAQAVWDLIKVGIDSINWGAVGDQLGNFASGAWAAIQTGISLAWDQITDLNWDNYITAIGDFAGLVAGKIKDLPWGDYLSAVGDLGILIAGKIKDLPWGDFINGAVDLALWISAKIKDFHGATSLPARSI
jgi:TP901 family phage tail tape measure protein